MRAFSSVGRASPLQGEGQKFESSNAHHKRDDDISYHLFYFACFDRENSFKKFGGFADGRHEVSPDSEETERLNRKV